MASIEVISELTELEILEIKHNFHMKNFNAEKVRGSFPKVWRLVLDVPRYIRYGEAGDELYDHTKESKRMEQPR